MVGIPLRFTLVVLPASCLIAACSGTANPSLQAAPTLAPRTSNLTPQQSLGQFIFQDKTLSEPAGVSCASCHNSSAAFTGNNGSTIPSVAVGSMPGTFGSRNVPMLTYASFSPSFGFYPIGDSDDSVNPSALNPFGGQFWDGRAATLNAQVSGPLFNPIEMNNTSQASVVAKVQVASYAPLFQSVCGANIFTDTGNAFFCLSNAIAAFEESPQLQPFSSKFDFYLQGKAQLTPTEAQGFALFKDPTKGNCISCHVANVNSSYPEAWPFTDHGYDSIGVPRNMNLPANADPTFYDLGLCQQPGLAAIAPQGFDITTLCTNFKTPSLRNVALTAPYGHNGYFQTLTDVVNFYATRDTNPGLWYPTDSNGHIVKFNDSPSQYQVDINANTVPLDLTAGAQPHLDASDIAAIVAFLNTLTDGYSN